MDLQQLNIQLPNNNTTNKVDVYNRLRNDFWYGATYNESGDILTYKDSYEYWDECTYDESGNKLTYKDSYGRWSEYTYDESDNLLTNTHGTTKT
jgi:YD repeat-containing protein